MYQQKRQQLRNRHGVSIILLVLTFELILILAGFFSVDIIEILMLQRQLEGVCQAAVLTGTSLLAGADVTNDDAQHTRLAAAQLKASGYAANIVLLSHIMGRPLKNATSSIELSELKDKKIDPYTCRYIILLTDPKNKFAVVEPGNPNGRSFRCDITYGYKPLCLSLVDIETFGLAASCTGALPEVDSVLVFDLSCSMDDETAVTFVRREWIHSDLGLAQLPSGALKSYNGIPGIIQYVSLPCPTSPHTISNYLMWDYGVPNYGAQGSLVNVLPPQNLDMAGNQSNSTIRHPMYFNAYLRSHYSHYNQLSNYQLWQAAAAPYCRATDFAAPPGNCDLSVALGGNGDGITDMLGSYNPAKAVPSANAFSDWTWQTDGNNYFGYQPAAPGALTGLGKNDVLPTTDVQTFTDLVVNIADPGAYGSPGVAQSFDQPLDGPDDFIGFSYQFPNDEIDPLLRNQAFNFANIGVVVEAARGNLEATPALANTRTNAALALINGPVSVNGTMFDMSSVTLKDGYQRAYTRLAMLFVQPMATVMTAMEEGYLEKLHSSADCRFGLVGFSSKGSIDRRRTLHGVTQGTLNDQSLSPSNQRSFYIFLPPYADPLFSNAVYNFGNQTSSGLNDNTIVDGDGQGFRIPRVQLDVNDEHYLECVSKNKQSNGAPNILSNSGTGANGIYNCRAESVTDTSEALQAAREMFHSSTYNVTDSAKSRAYARQLILFFTDGEPTGGVHSNEAGATYRVAGAGGTSKTIDTCQADGLSICTIGLNLAKGDGFEQLRCHQMEFLGDRPSSSEQEGGLAWRAGNMGRYYPCSSLIELKSAIADITRRFVQSVR